MTGSAFDLCPDCGYVLHEHRPGACPQPIVRLTLPPRRRFERRRFLASPSPENAQPPGRTPVPEVIVRRVGEGS
jgi:hypothetical protein